MEIKVTISLSNGVSITVETNGSSSNQELITSILKELAAELAGLHLSDTLKGSSHAELKNGEGELSYPQLVSTVDANEEYDKGSVDSENAFIEFCETHSPIGDMRRLVIAAEGASKYLDVHQVSPHELNRLFHLASWPIPKDLLQSLRNSARRSFQWFQRVPGRQGYYSVTDKGRNAVAGISR